MKQRKQNGFTILEMIIVLSIIALIFLLTLPNIQQKQEIIHNKGCEALVEVVNAQVLLYEVEHLVPPTSISQLIAEGYLKEEQRRCPAGEMIEIVNGEAYAK
ncbi:MAG: prepilin-type N-terminal cleavage/methylation domain-containing protein [Erysipelotrichaceae bacterium]|jgi:competence protein ComGC|nr:prepilin-type N-terminal cleavage/methylation domain-containing protein [Erysipelotrichaceae bacterium]MCI9523785.1 prepilin-type N-terminal cleavage/methylation domain-containing protein [Erysipelotrichaceae bacterium]